MAEKPVVSRSSLTSGRGQYGRPPLQLLGPNVDPGQLEAIFHTNGSVSWEKVIGFLDLSVVSL